MKKKESLAITFIVLCIIALTLLNACAKVTESLVSPDSTSTPTANQTPTSNPTQKQTSSPTQTVTTGGVTGKLIYPNGTMVVYNTGTIVFIKGGLTISSGFTVDNKGDFTITSRPTGNYEIGVKVSDGAIEYVGTISNVLIQAGDITNLGNINLQGLGVMACRLVYDTPLTNLNVSFSDIKLPSGIIYFISGDKSVPAEATQEAPRLDAWITLPQGTHTLKISPKGLYNGEAVSFNAITVTATIVAGITKNIGTLYTTQTNLINPNKIISIEGFKKGNISVYAIYDDNQTQTGAITQNVLDDNYTAPDHAIHDGDNLIKIETITNNDPNISLYKLTNSGYVYKGCIDDTGNNISLYNLSTNLSIALPLVLGITWDFQGDTIWNYYKNEFQGYTMDTHTTSQIVEKFVNITTPCGTFHCAKIICTLTAFISNTQNKISYKTNIYVAKEGIIKKEVFDSDGTLISSQILISKNW